MSLLMKYSELNNNLDENRIIIANGEKKDNAFIKKDTVYSRSIASAAFYFICSTSMAFINKAVLSSYEFNYAFFIMACQMIASIIFLEILRIFQVITLSKYTLKHGAEFFWPTFFYAVHSITSLHAISGMSIPMYAAVKRCSPLVTLILSTYILKKPFPSIKVILGISCITLGCLMAGFGDLQFDMTAYCYGTVSAVTQGLYLTLVQKGAESNLSALQILHLNSYNTLPVYIVISCILGETHNAISDAKVAGEGFIPCFLLQLVIGALLSYSLFLCTTDNSALTTSLVGVMKSVIQTVVGSFTFGGVKFNILNVCGIGLNTYGGMMYVYAKYREKEKATKPSPLTMKPV